MEFFCLLSTTPWIHKLDLENYSSLLMMTTYFAPLAVIFGNCVPVNVVFVKFDLTPMALFSFPDNMWRDFKTIL
jgi:hypothetical protein